MSGSSSSATPILLALDTSTEVMHIGVCRGARQVWVRELPGGALSSETLLPAIFSLLQEAGLRLDQLDALAFGQGPGAFTGVRTACAVVQGLALGASLPVLALDSLQAVAEDAVTSLEDDEPGASTALRRCCVAVDARMGEVYWGLYERDGERWLSAQAPQLSRPDDLVRRLLDPCEPIALLAGNALQVHAQEFSALQSLVPRQRAQARPAARALLRLSLQSWQAGLCLDAALALPVYVRDKVAQTTEERARLQSAGVASA